MTGPPVGFAVALPTLGAAVVVLAGAALTLPSPDRATVLAATPWMLVGGLLHALATSGAYEGLLAGLFGTLLAAPATVVLAGVPWLLLVHAGRLRGRSAPAGYLAAAGVGAALLPTLAVVLRGSVSAGTATAVVVVPVIAAVATAAVVLALGLGGATALAETRSLGLLALYGQAFGGVALAVATDALGAPARGPLAGPLVRLGGSVGPGAVGTAWPFVLLSLAGSGLAVVGLTRLLDEHETAAYLTMGAVGALGLGPGLSRVLTAAVL